MRKRDFNEVVALPLGGSVQHNPCFLYVRITFGKNPYIARDWSTHCALCEILTLSQISNRGYSYFLFSELTGVATCSAVFLRIWIRSVISRSFAVEDVLLLLSMVFFVGLSTCGAVKALHGFGSHLNEIPLDQLEVVYKCLYTGCVFIYLAIMSVRLSLCMLFLRITEVPWQRQTIYGIAIVTTIVNLVILLRFNIFHCNPISYYWNSSVTVGGECVSPSTLRIVLYFQYSTATAADWITSFLPIFILKDWTADVRAKRITYGLLGMGILASGASLAAIILNPPASDGDDYTFSAYKIFIAQITEPFMGILAASFATYRPLFRWLKSTAQKSLRTKTYADWKRITGTSNECKAVEIVPSDV